MAPADRVRAAPLSCSVRPAKKCKSTGVISGIRRHTNGVVRAPAATVTASPDEPGSTASQVSVTSGL